MSVSARMRSGSTAGWLLAAAAGLVVVALIVLGVSFGLGLFGGGEPERAAAGAPHLRPTANPTAAPDTAALRQRDALARGERSATRVEATRHAALKHRAAVEEQQSSVPTSSTPVVPAEATPAPTLGPQVIVPAGGGGAPAPSTPKPASTPAPPPPNQPVLGGGGDG